MDNAVLIFRPVIQVRAERVAEVLGIGTEQANKMLSQPEAREFLQAGLEQAFQKATTEVLQGMVRTAIVSVPGPRVDCAVALPALPNFVSRIG